MATLTDSAFPNLVNWAKLQKPDGGISDMVDLLSKANPILEDIPWVEGNLPTGHRITSVQSVPSASWRKLNAGVAAVKGDTAQFDETCGILETESKVDRALAELNGTVAAFRDRQDRMIIEGMSQQFATAVMYESVTTNPERIHGLTPRYGATSGTTTASYVFTSATHSGDDGQSIWLASWEPGKLYGIYPKGSMAGLKREDMGLQRVLDGSSNAFWAYVTNFQWKCGIAVEDYRYAVRYQWDPSSAECADTATGLPAAMTKMMNLIYKVLPSTRFYMNRTSKAKLDAQLASNSNNLLQYIHTEDGRLIPSFMGVPIRVIDSLVTETSI